MYGVEDVHTPECVWWVLDCEDVLSRACFELRKCTPQNVFGVYVIMRMV